jgi:hypothetical protein
MIRTLRRALRRTRFYPLVKRLGHYPDYLYWRLRGQPQRSPHWLKQRTVKEYARRFGLRTLIETGTYYGEMITATRDWFQRIYSVELDDELYQRARREFGRYPHITILHGDSQQVIPELLQSIQEPCLFWLDAGYYGWAGLSGNKGRLTAELEAIFAHPVPGHVVLMDDARGLNGRDGAPSWEQFRQYVQSACPDRVVELRHDMVRIYKPQAAQAPCQLAPHRK